MNRREFSIAHLAKSLKISHNVIIFMLGNAGYRSQLTLNSSVDQIWVTAIQKLINESGIDFWVTESNKKGIDSNQAADNSNVDTNSLSRQIEDRYSDFIRLKNALQDDDFNKIYFDCKVPSDDDIAIAKQWLSERSKSELNEKLGAIDGHVDIRTKLVRLSRYESRVDDFARALNDEPAEIPVTKLHEDTEKEYVRMLSARMGENAARCFYENLGAFAEDISISQIQNPNSTEWKLFDIRLSDGQKCIDVKNARKIKHDSTRYSEFCIPQFKKTRNDKSEVSIVATLSPAVWFLRYIIDPSSVYWESPKTFILGETTLNTVTTLKNNYDEFHLDFDDDVHSVPTYLPPWVFDYPGSFYKNRETAIESIQQVEWPTFEELQSILVNPIPLFLMTNKNLPDVSLAVLKKWQIDFYNKLIEVQTKLEGKLTLPHVFLEILQHFIRMFRTGHDEYEPSDYKKLFFKNDITRYPIGIYDPLQTIKDLCDTLQTLWSSTRTITLPEMENFKFTGRGLLTATDVSKHQTITLIAYCGGSINNKPCAKYPLIYGREDTCSECGHLVCSNCGFCKQECANNPHEIKPNVF